MKKLYTLIAGLVLASAASAQTIDLTDHTEGVFAGVAAGKYPAIVSLTAQGGYVAGSMSVTEQGTTYNNYAVAQMFDASNGVVAGTIGKVQFAVAEKIGTGSSIVVSVNEAEDYDYQGVTYYTPGTVIASKTLTLAELDTTTAATNYIGTYPTALKGAYNNTVTFTGANVPSDKRFFVLVSLPQVAGDSLALMHTVSSTSVPQLPTTYYGAYSYTGESSGVINGSTTTNAVYYSYPELFQNADWANLIYASVTSSVTSTNMEEVTNVLVYPNPAQDVLNFEFEGAEISLINIFSIEGKLVSSSDFAGVSNAALNISNLVEGTYVYEVKTVNGGVARQKFVKN